MHETATPPQMGDIAHLIQDRHQQITAIAADLNQLILGQATIIETCLVTLLANGHALLVGVPGLAKTRLVQAIGQVTGLDAKRIQCTPDLMPGDILGSEILDQQADGQRFFRFVKGPVFSQLLMGDEINRAPPRTQSALLQAMQERQVTISGTEHLLPRPFHVIATQNPLEQEGTYPLPEAQLDRFMTHIHISYPDQATEKQILQLPQTDTEPALPARIQPADLCEMQDIVQQIPVPDALLNAIIWLVRAARPAISSEKKNDLAQFIQTYVQWGPGPRAGQALIMCLRARAFFHNKPAPDLDDLMFLAPMVLRHRIVPSFQAHTEKIRADDISQHLCQTLLAQFPDLPDSADD